MPETASYVVNENNVCGVRNTVGIGPSVGL